MQCLNKLFAGRPAAARVMPFVVFLVLTGCQGKFGAASADWFYLAKTLIGAWLIGQMRPLVTEMRWAVSWEAVVVGVLIFVVWVGLDPWYPKLFSTGATGNPFTIFGAGSGWAWFFIAVHVLGMTLVVPPLEEVFYRSFLYRSLADADFLSVPLNRFRPIPFLVTTVIFGLAHNEWLAGMLCGAAYQGLTLRKNRLGDAMLAHAVTNFLLGVWIVWRGAWNFW
ncbi:MAG TPA: CAAX prenyl protease-related protein [Verrucomicrobiae bacterium]|nr:CAAX prenyl protease-related protein [Verrucomicrobiae bacterium]